MLHRMRHFTRPRFRLRTLLIVVVLAALACGFVARERAKQEQMRRVLAQLRDARRRAALSQLRDERPLEVAARLEMIAKATEDGRGPLLNSTRWASEELALLPVSGGESPQDARRRQDLFLVVAEAEELADAGDALAVEWRKRAAELRQRSGQLPNGGQGLANEYSRKADAEWSGLVQKAQARMLKAAASR